MTHTKTPLWHWETFPVSGYTDPVYRPRIETWMLATPCEQPTVNEYPYKPWDIHYDRRQDPAMVILDANRAAIETKEYKSMREAYAHGYFSCDEFLNAANSISAEHGRKAERAIKRLEYASRKFECDKLDLIYKARVSWRKNK